MRYINPRSTYFLRYLYKGGLFIGLMC